MATTLSVWRMDLVATTGSFLSFAARRNIAGNLPFEAKKHEICMIKCSHLFLGTFFSEGIGGA